jgi:hypothetical protein
MPHRLLSIAEDETWKDGMRLVCIDAVSNFILREQTSDERSAVAWTRALEGGLEGLNVTVAQGTSDEAKGLLAHVERDLDAHHATDLFHLQHEVSQAMSLSPKRRAAGGVRRGQHQGALARRMRRRTGLSSAPPRPGAPAGVRRAHR